MCYIIKEGGTWEFSPFTARPGGKVPKMCCGAPNTTHCAVSSSLRVHLCSNGIRRFLFSFVGLFPNVLFGATLSKPFWGSYSAPRTARAWCLGPRDTWAKCVWGSKSFSEQLLTFCPVPESRDRWMISNVTVPYFPNRFSVFSRVKRTCTHVTKTTKIADICIKFTIYFFSTFALESTFY